MMLRPHDIWVANIRTIYAHFLIEYDWDYEKVDEAWELYKVGELESEMAYQYWREIYPRMENSQNTLIAMGNQFANDNDAQPSPARYIWADCIADSIYNYYDDEE